MSMDHTPLPAQDYFENRTVRDAMPTREPGRPMAVTRLPPRSRSAVPPRSTDQHDRFLVAVFCQWLHGMLYYSVYFACVYVYVFLSFGCCVILTNADVLGVVTTPDALREEFCKFDIA